MSNSTTASQFVAIALVALSIGYAFGARSASTRLSAERSKPASLRHEPPNPGKDVKEDGESEEEEELADGDLGSVKAGFLEPCKMVLVVRSDLGMSPGKIAAQCSHASLACYKSLVKTNPQLVRHWERTGQAKIALKATSEDQLLELEAIAKSLNLCARSILDAGRTQIAAGSRTVLGIGPAPVELINKVTGKLRLL